MHARVVELDALTDAVGTGTQDDDGFALAWTDLVLLVVGRVVVRRAGCELGGAGVDRLEDGVDTKRAAYLAHRVLGQAAHRSDLPVGETVALRLGEDVARECLGLANAGRDLVEEEHLVEEPRVDLRRLEELLERRTTADRLLDLDETSLGANCGGLNQGTGFFGGGRLSVPVELHTALIDRAQGLLQRLCVGAADRHGLAHGLHRGGEGRVGSRELLEGEARDLDDHVVERRLERGRGRARDVVRDLVEGVAGGEARGDLRDREARRLRGQRGRTRHARVHLDDDDAARLGVNRELDVTAAGVHAHGADDGDTDVAQTLHLAVGEGQRRSDRDRVTRVHADRVDVLDRTHDDDVVRLVAHELELVFLPAEDRLLEENLGRDRGSQALAGDALEVFGSVSKTGAEAAHREGGANDEGVSELGGGRVALLHRVGDEGTCDLGTGALDDLLELLAVLTGADRVDGCADKLDVETLKNAHFGQRDGRVQRRLAAQRGKQCVGAFLFNNRGHDLRGDRLDVRGVGDAGVGHDGCRVGVDEDDAQALLLQHAACLRA